MIGLFYLIKMYTYIYIYVYMYNYTNVVLQLSIWIMNYVVDYWYLIISNRSKQLGNDFRDGAHKMRNRRPPLAVTIFLI